MNNIETIKFRTLNADEVEVRRGYKVGNTPKYELLLYKTARTDAKLLTETVGVFWKKWYKSVNGMTVCVIEIKNPSTGEWIPREDVGSEQNFEKEKSLFSDAFKRAGFAWGLGIELYSAPKIVIYPLSDFETYEVESIGYDENRRINNLKIVNDEGKLVYQMTDGVETYSRQMDPEVEAEFKKRKKELREYCVLLHDNGEDEAEIKSFFETYKSRVLRYKTWNQGTPEWLWNTKDSYKEKN